MRPSGFPCLELIPVLRGGAAEPLKAQISNAFGRGMVYLAGQALCYYRATRLGWFAAVANLDGAEHKDLDRRGREREKLRTGRGRNRAGASLISCKQRFWQESKEHS